MSGDETWSEGIEAYRDESRRPLVRLYDQYGRAESRILAVGLIASILSYAAALVTPVVLGTTIDAVFTGESEYTLPLVPTTWVPPEPAGQFWISVSLVGIALALTTVMAWVRGVAMNHFAHSVMLKIRVDAYKHLQQLDMSFFDTQETGELMSVLNNDTTNLERFLDNAIRESVRVGVTVTGITALLLYMNWQLAFVTLLIVPVLVGFTWWFMITIEPRYAKKRSAVGNLNTRLENALTGIGLVKRASAEDYEGDRIDNVASDLFDAEMAAIRLSVLYRPGMELLTGVTVLATFLIGGLWVFTGPPLFLTGTLTVGEFVVFILLTQRLAPPLAQLAKIVDWYQNARASGKRIVGLLDAPVRIEDDPNPLELSDYEGHVEYDDVIFAYDDGNCVLNGIDFSVNAGETVALVGPTGSGKSTAAKLLLRLFDASDGAIRIDGHDVRKLSLESLRKSVGYVSQDPVMFDGTVAENIRYGQFDASDQAVREAARVAEAHGFIKEFPDGYDTQVGERGVKISGGQRQRIALARVVLWDPTILVLDEATASVDTRTELAIQRSLDRINTERTTFVIAHRLSTVTDADCILVLNDGKIVERGKHDDLIEQGGLYANLWSVQSGDDQSVSDDVLY
ncbi:ABC transporter ATP-binding protein [Haloarcula salina]|uniref:ABC transporter ATP-binding protein n=1 Tax=Haloarcula salina TaxID=1429914 RepID=UPI003C6F1E73